MNHLRSRPAQFQKMIPRTQHRSLSDRDSHLSKNSGIESLTLHIDRNLIDAWQILTLNNTFQSHVTKTGHFLTEMVVQMQFRSQDKNVGLNTCRLQFFYTMLSRFSLQFSCRFQIRHIGKVHTDGIPTQLPFHLSDSFQERCALNISYGTANLSNDEVISFFCPGQILNASLNLIGDMWNHLNGFAQIVAPTLLVYDRLINPACSH